MNKEELILLNMSNVGKKALEKLPKEDLSKKISAAKKENDLDAELNLVKKNNVEVITVFDKSYPKLLKEIYSPPLVLYVKGAMLKKEEIAIAVVGSRYASVYGITTAERLGYELASRGVVVVSGLAKGIDSAAHRGALKAHGKTVAVLGNGLKTVYPPENKKLAEEIVEKGGAVVSEFPMDTLPISRNFPRRNRIISGLSLGVIVVEAARNSGALITADFALEQNREVFAVPGKIDSATSFGANELIKQGAKLVQTADDVIEELGLELKDSKIKDDKNILRPNLSAEEKVIYNNLSKQPRYVDEIVEDAKFSVNKTMEVLLKLQLKKLVRELPGKNFVKIG